MRDRRRAQRPADRARRVHVALGRECLGGRHDLAARRRRARLVDVGDEHHGPLRKQVAGQVIADRPRALHEHAAAREVGGAEHVLDARADAVQHAACGAAATVASGACRAVHPRARLVHDVEILGCDVHVAGRAVRPAERGDELPVTKQQRTALLSRRQLGHREHRLAPTALAVGNRHLHGHRLREPHRVREAVRRPLVHAHARPASGRPERGRVHAHEDPRAARLVVADDGFLPVPAAQELLEHPRSLQVPAGSPLHSAAGMAGERTKLIVKTREQLGSSETRRLRRQGLIPGVLYGAGDPVAISIEERELRRALTGAAGLHSILDVEIDGTGKAHASILKDYQLDKVRGGVTHVDLHEVRLDRAITASVSVHLIGGDNAPGVKEGGVLSQPLREIQVEALPLEVPEHIDLDVSHMATGDTLRIGDVVVQEGVKFLDDPETVVATVTAPTREVEPEEAPAEEGEEGVEGEGAAEGEQPEGGAEAPAESDGDSAGDSGTTEG